MNIEKYKQLAVVNVAVDGCCSFLKLEQLHHDLAKLLLLQPQQLHYHGDNLRFA